MPDLWAMDLDELEVLCRERGHDMDVAVDRYRQACDVLYQRRWSAYELEDDEHVHESRVERIEREHTYRQMGANL